MTVPDSPAGAARALLEAAIASREVEAWDGRRLALHSELPPLEGAVLQHWLRESGARRLLEVGCAFGVSTLYICEAIAGVDIEHYHIIDPYQSTQWSNVGRRHLEIAAPRRPVEFHETLSEICLPGLLERGLRFDFAYIDGWHTFDQVMLEFYYVNRMLDVGGVVVFDDVHLPSLQKALACIATYPAYELLSPPPPVCNSLQAKVRRAAGVPPIRLQALAKVSEDERDWHWFEAF